MGSGLVLTGFIEQMWQGYLTYGVGVGVGAACAYADACDPRRLVQPAAQRGAWNGRRRHRMRHADRVSLTGW
jgi:hypothetical protein